jgi:hypothetical protein
MICAPLAPSSGLARKICGTYLANLHGVSLGQRATEDGEVLREDKDNAAVNCTLTGHDTVAGNLVGLAVHTELSASVFYEGVVFAE